jgi:hypothetical protein
VAGAECFEAAYKTATLATRPSIQKPSKTSLAQRSASNGAGETPLGLSRAAITGTLGRADRHRSLLESRAGQRYQSLARSSARCPAVKCVRIAQANPSTVAGCCHRLEPAQLHGNCMSCSLATFDSREFFGQAFACESGADVIRVGVSVSFDRAW